MYRHFVHLVAGLAVLLMIVPPVCDTFDRWDRRPEMPMVGHNTETTVVVFTADLGLCMVVAWASIQLMQWLVAVFAPYILIVVRSSFGPLMRATDYFLLLFSPPWRQISLRI